MPGQPFFDAAVFVLALSALLFLFNLNVVLKQLGAMLPDEPPPPRDTAVHHPQPLAARWPFVLGGGYAVFLQFPQLQSAFGDSAWWLDRLSFWR